MLDELGLTYMFINGSEESGIDVLRTKIKNFASTVSLHGGRKYLILDEADYLNPQSTQPALRGFIEEFSKNCGFILTCNYKNRIISPLHSRCSVVDFTIPKSEKQELAGQFFDRVLEILNNISYLFCIRHSLLGVLLFFITGKASIALEISSTICQKFRALFAFHKDSLAFKLNKIRFSFAATGSQKQCRNK